MCAAAEEVKSGSSEQKAQGQYGRWRNSSTFWLKKKPCVLHALRRIVVTYLYEEPELTWVVFAQFPFRHCQKQRPEVSLGVFRYQSKPTCAVQSGSCHCKPPIISREQSSIKKLTKIISPPPFTCRFCNCWGEPRLLLLPFYGTQTATKTFQRFSLYVLFLCTANVIDVLWWMQQGKWCSSTNLPMCVYILAEINLLIKSQRLKEEKKVLKIIGVSIFLNFFFLFCKCTIFLFVHFPVQQMATALLVVVENCLGVTSPIHTTCASLVMLCQLTQPPYALWAPSPYYCLYLLLSSQQQCIAGAPWPLTRLPVNFLPSDAASSPQIHTV